MSCRNVEWDLLRGSVSYGCTICLGDKSGCETVYEMQSIGKESGKVNTTIGGGICTLAI